ncbi:retrotransposon protein, putative, ty1-copia subclass, partial [Tanacetum coccineum]
FNVNTIVIHRPDTLENSSREVRVAFTVRVSCPLYAVMCFISPMMTAGTEQWDGLPLHGCRQYPKACILSGTSFDVEMPASRFSSDGGDVAVGNTALIYTESTPWSSSLLNFRKKDTNPAPLVDLRSSGKPETGNPTKPVQSCNASQGLKEIFHLTQLIDAIVKQLQIDLSKYQGFDPHSLQGRRSFSTFGRIATNLSTLGRGRLSTSQPPPYTVEDGICEMSKNSLDTTNEDLQQLPAVKSETGGLKQKLRHARYLLVGLKWGLKWVNLWDEIGAGLGAEMGVETCALGAEVGVEMAHMGVGLGAEMGDGMGCGNGVEDGRPDMSACGLREEILEIWAASNLKGKFWGSSIQLYLVGVRATFQWSKSGLPDSFWAEATVTAAYLINRSPSTALEKKTPMDLWSGHPANYEMLRIFGCVAYSHVNQGKLKPRAIKCIFLGYPDGVKGYRLWRLDDVKPKIIISRDVVFNESLMYKDTLKGAGAADSGKEVEFEVELQGSRVEPTVDPHTGENPGNEDEEQDEGPQQQNLDNYVLVRDRAKRTTTIPARYRDEGNVSLSRPSGSKVDDMAAYAFAIAEEEDTHEPITFQEAINSSEKDEWVRAMEEEMSSLKKNHTWELVDQPPGQKLVSCKWLYKIKEGIEGIQKPRYKARLVARGFTQRAGIDYNEAATCNGFSRSSYDSCVYFKEFAPGMYIYLLLYVDDMLIACKSKSEIEYTKGLLRKEFDMKELGPARKILGMEIVRDRGSRTLKVSQSGYVQKILNNYRMDNGKSVSVPLGAHFKVSLKDCPPDIAYAVSIVSRYLANPGLVYGRDQGKHMDVDGFVDADYAKDPDKGRSITGYSFSLEVEDSAVEESHGSAQGSSKDNAKVVSGGGDTGCVAVVGVQVRWVAAVTVKVAWV